MPKYSLLELLWMMKRGELLHIGYGICYHLGEHCAEYRERSLARRWMQEWPEYSGQSSYPVPAGGCDPEGAYDAGLEDDTLWVGEYGASRKRLLNYLITRCEASDYA